MIPLPTPSLDNPTSDPSAMQRAGFGLGLGLLAFAVVVFATAEHLADWRFTVHQKNALEQAQKISDAVASDLQLPIHAGLTALAMAQYTATLAQGREDPAEAAHNDKLRSQLNQGGLGLTRLRIATADGRLLGPEGGSRQAGNVAERDFFKAIQSASTTNHDSPALAVGRPFVETDPGPAIIPLARDIRDDGGKLDGVLFLGLAPDSISQRMRQEGGGDGAYSSLRLIRLTDGVTLASLPPAASELDVRSLPAQMRRDPRGHLARIGRPAHIVAWTRLSELPVAVYVSRDADPVMLPAAREILLIRIAASGIMVLSLLIAALAWHGLAHRRTRVALAVAKAAQDATASARAEMEQSIESLPAAIYRCDILADDSYIITYISKNASAVLGPNLLQRDQPGFWISNAIPEDRAAVAEFRKRARETGIATQEYRLANSEGGFTWVRHSARYLSRHPDGSGTVLGSLENIDEEIHLREEITCARIDLETRSLARAYEQVNTLISGLPVVIFHSRLEADFSLTRLFTSSNAASVYGPGPGDVSLSTGFQGRILPEDRHLMQDHLAHLRHADQGTVEFRLRRDDIDIFWVRTHSRTIKRHADGAVEFVGSTADITAEIRLREQITRERIANETASVSAAYETLNRLLTDLPIAVVRVRCHADDRLEPLFHSAGMEKLVGPPPPGVEDPLRLTERISAEDRARVHDGILQMRTGRPFPTMEVACKRGDGQTTWLRIHTYPTDHYEDGSFDYIGTLIDISEERQSRARTEINTRLSTLGEMATGIAHELNQPLFLITMAAENAALEAQNPTPNRAYLAQNIERLRTQALRASRIIDHLQAFTRQDSERAEPVSLAAAIEGARSLVGGMLQQWQIEMHLQLPDGLALILGQPTRVEQVLVNLLLNARDALNAKPVGQRRITLMASAVGDTVQLQIADTGTGVPEEILQRIFEPFFTTKDPNTGAGLGLSICHGAMRTMGGDITVRNDPAGGAVFTLTFRAAETITQAA